MNKTNKLIEFLYLDWVNNFLTMEKFAEHYGISEEFASKFIKMCQKEFSDNDKPEYGKQYALTGGSGDKCILNGNTWEESKVK